MQLGMKRETKDFILSVFLGVLVIAVMIGMVVRNDPEQERALPKFEPGDEVQMRMFGTRGMVVSSRCFSTCMYSVRFSAMQIKTNTGIFTADGPLDFTPVALVRGIKEFELERWQNPQ